MHIKCQDLISLKCQALFSLKKKKEKTPRNVFVISALRFKPFLIYCAATANARKIAYFI